LQQNINVVFFGSATKHNIVFFFGSAAGHELVFFFAEQLQNCPELCMAPH
jgi:hypothetical protein